MAETAEQKSLRNGIYSRLLAGDAAAAGELTVTCMWIAGKVVAESVARSRRAARNRDELISVGHESLHDNILKLTSKAPLVEAGKLVAYLKRSIARDIMDFEDADAVYGPSARTKQRDRETPRLQIVAIDRLASLEGRDLTAAECLEAMSLIESLAPEYGRVGLTITRPTNQLTAGEIDQDGNLCDADIFDANHAPRNWRQLLAYNFERRRRSDDNDLPGMNRGENTEPLIREDLLRDPKRKDLPPPKDKKGAVIPHGVHPHRFPSRIGWAILMRAGECLVCHERRLRGLPEARFRIDELSRTVRPMRVKLRDSYRDARDAGEEPIRTIRGEGLRDDFRRELLGIRQASDTDRRRETDSLCEAVRLLAHGQQENRVLSLIGDGLSYSEIAAKLAVAPSTITRTVQRLRMRHEEFHAASA